MRHLLPPLRALIVKGLVEDKGWSITRAAKALRITVPAASKYRRILSRRHRIDMDILERTASRLVEGIARGVLGDQDFIRAVCSLCMNLRIDGEICRLHRLEIPELRECTLCGELFRDAGLRSAERSRVLAELREGLRILSGIKGFERLIPEVRTNLVMAVEGARSLEDVAGFPGRITVVKGRAHAPAGPEFGASKHMATILLSVMRRRPELRSVICLKYSEEVLRGLRELGFSVEFIDRDRYGSVEEYVARGWRGSAALVDPGGVGIEPIIYLFDRDATALARTVRRLAGILGSGH